MPLLRDTRIGMECFIHVFQPEWQRCTIASGIKLSRLERLECVRVEEYATRGRSEAIVIVGQTLSGDEERPALHFVGCLPAFADTIDALRRDVLVAQREATRYAGAKQLRKLAACPRAHDGAQHARLGTITPVYRL